MGKLIPSLQCYFYYDCRMFFKKDKNDERPDSQNKPLIILHFYLNRAVLLQCTFQLRKMPQI